METGYISPFLYFFFSSFHFQHLCQSIQSHRTVSVEFTEGDRSRRLHRNLCKSALSLRNTSLNSSNHRFCCAFEWNGNVEWELLEEVHVQNCNHYRSGPVLFIPLPVPCLEDQPHPQVGGSVEGARLSGTDCIFRRQRGERPLPQVLTICMLSLCFALEVCKLVPVNVMHGFIWFFSCLVGRSCS